MQAYLEGKLVRSCDGSAAEAPRGSTRMAFEAVPRFSQIPERTIRWDARIQVFVASCQLVAVASAPANYG